MTLRRFHILKHLTGSLVCIATVVWVRLWNPDAGLLEQIISAFVVGIAYQWWFDKFDPRKKRV